MEFLMRDGIISVLFLVVGGGFYLVISHMLDSIGREGIDRVYETKKERLARIRMKKKVGKIYAMSLFLMVIAINLAFYYFRKEGI
jgi:fructose-specific phosphotransferase system IIC component